ncbi:MAG: DsbA family oxidoreductase, partial [Balneolaceae bacterium]|nr:DsbA family oxidoreductase [Balneolaceae bacterium]
QANEELRQQAAALGLSLKPDQIIPTNSFDAHRLVKLAAEHGRAGEAQERLFSAYFAEGRHIARPETLKQVGTGIGIESEKIEQMLAGDEFAEQVRADEQEARKIGIRGVPFFLFNRQYAIPGALPVDSFLETLEKVREAGESRAMKT